MSNTMRESADERSATENPFKSGSAMEQFEVKVAKKDQLNETSIASKFLDSDLKNASIREYTKDRNVAQAMKK